MSTVSPDAIALLNICANGGEILGISSGLPLLILSFIPHSSGLKGYSLKLAGLGLVMAIVGLAFPGIVNILTESLSSGAMPNTVVAGIAALLATLFLIVSWLAAFFMPTIIAVREQREKKVWIIVCNCFAFLPGPWLIALIWACMADKTPVGAPETPISG